MRAQQVSSTGSDFAKGLLQQQSRLREHLDFAGQANRSLKEGIEAARRKLNSSASTGVLRQQEARNFVAVQGRPSRDLFSTSQTPQHNTHSLLVRKGAPEVPQETDEEIGQLRREVAILRRENDGLRQVIAQNDASARFAIGQLQGALDAARQEGQRNKIQNERMRTENEKVRNALEQATKQSNDSRGQIPAGRQDTPCLKCPKLQAKIRELQSQLSELSIKLSESARQLQIQSSRRNEVTVSSESFRQEMSMRLKNMEGWLRARNEEIMALEQKNLELSRRMTERERQLNQQLTTLTEEYYAITQGKQRAEMESRRANNQLQTVERQLRESQKQSREAIGKVSFLNNKIQALNTELWQRTEEREKTDIVLAFGELEEKIGELRYRLEQKEGESKELEARLQEREINLKRLGEEYSSSLERAEQLQEITNQLRQRNEDLQSEIDRLRNSQFPASFSPNQLLAKINALDEQLQVEQENARQMQDKLQERENTITYLQNQIQSNLSTYQAAAFQTQGQINQLSQTLEALTQKNHIIAGQYTQLHTTLTYKQEQAASEMEDLVRRLQHAQAALERLNKHPLQTGEERKIAQLQDLVSTLRQEKAEYVSLLERARQYQQDLQKGAIDLQQRLHRAQDERNDLGEQVERFRQQLWERNSNEQEASIVQSLKREVSALQERVSILRQENNTVKSTNLTLEQQKNTLAIEKNSVEQENASLKKENITLQTKKDQAASVDSTRPLPSQDAALKREITVLEQENSAIRQKFATFEQQVTSLQVQNSTLIEQSRYLTEENATCKKEIKDLTFEKEIQYNNLERAENYIATLLEQANPQAKPTSTPRDEAATQENRILASQRKSLLEQNQTLRIKIDQLTKQLRTPPAQSPIRDQRDPSSNIEYANLQVKNEELVAHISIAQNYISSLKQKAQELVQSEQRAHNTLMHEREAKGELERIILSKDALIEKQGRQFSQEIANRDALIDNLQRRIQEANRLQPVPTIPTGQTVPSSSQREAQEANQKIARLEDEISSLQRQKRQLEETKVQSDTLTFTLTKQTQNITKQIAQLRKEKAQEHEHLVRAEAYITELLEQIQQNQAGSDAAVLTQNQQLVSENKELSEMYKTLASKNEGLDRQNEKLRQDIQTAYAQIQALKDQQQKQPSSPVRPIPSQLDNTQALQLQSLKAKNEQLFSHLQNAESFITSLQEELRNLNKAQEESVSILAREKQARMSLEQTLSLNEGQKDKTIYELRQELQRVNLSLNTLALSSQQEDKRPKGEDGNADRQKTSELHAAIDALKFQARQQDIVLNHTSTQNQQLTELVNNLQAEISKYKQQISPSVTKEDSTDPSAKQALRNAKYQNEILAKQNRELTVRLLEQRGNLEKAEAYIAEMLNNLPKDQISHDQAAENARLINQLQKAAEQKKQLQISLENQVRLKKELQLQVEQLNTFLLRAQNQFERNAREASEQLRILKELSGAGPSKQHQTPSKVEAKPETNVPSPESMELIATKAKNQELYEHLKSAEEFIAEQEKKIQYLINNELQLKKALSVQSEARSRLQGQKTLKDAETQRIRLALEGQLREKDKLIEELGSNLRQATQAVNAYANQLREMEAPSFLPDDRRISQLEQLISTLKNECVQQDAVIASAKQQIVDLAAEKSFNSQILQKLRQRLERENEALKKKVDLVQLEKQTQIKNLENAEDYIASLLEQINREPQTQIDNNQRQALLEKQSQELQKERDALSANNLSITAQNKQISTANQTLSNEKSVLTAMVQTLQGDKKALQQQIRELQQKLQVQTDQTQQAKRNFNDLQSQLTDSKRELQRNAKELAVLQQSHQQLAKQLQNRLEQEQARQQKTPAPIQTTLTQSAQLQSLRNQNRELFNHLQGAQQFIMSMQKHIQSLGRAEQQLRNTLVQQQQAKRQIQSAISAKEAEVQRLNNEVSQSKTQLEPLRQKVNDLHSESSAAIERANLSEKQLAETVKQLNDLRAKLGQAEDYIISLQVEIDKLREFLVRAEASIAALTDQNNKIRQQPKQTQKLQRDDLQKINDTLKQEIQRLKKEKQAASDLVRQKSDNISRLLSEMQAMKMNQLRSATKPQKSQDVNFFKNKLIEAEDYIAQMEKLHNENGDIMAKQSAQLNAQAEKISQLQGNINKSAKQINDLANDLLRAQQAAKQLQETLKNQPNVNDLAQLSAKIKDLQGKLVNSEKDRQALSQANNDALKKLQQSQENFAALTREKTQAQSQIPVLLAKLQQAGDQVTIAQLQAKQQTPIDHSSLTQVNQFFKEKLRQAETFIFDNQKQMNKMQDEIHKLQEEKRLHIDDILQLRQLLQQHSSRPQETPADSPNIENVEFFKEKLLQAERYIHGMGQDYQRLAADGELKQKQIDALQEKSNDLENEVQRLADQLKNDRQQTKKLLLEAQQRQNAIHEERQRKSTELEDANNKIQQLLDQISRNEPKISKPYEQSQSLSSVLAHAEQLRQNLIQAENHIHEVDQVYPKLIAGLEAKQKQIDALNQQCKNLEDVIQDLSSQLDGQRKQAKRQLEEAEKREKSLIYEKADTKQPIQQIEPLLQKLSQLQKERDTANQRANYSEALLMDTVKHLEEVKEQPLADPVKDQAMIDHIRSVENEAGELETANNHLRDLLEKSQEESQQLHDKLRQLEELAKAADNGAAKLLEKLAEAESYIYELQGQNQRIKQAPVTNNDEMDRLKAKLTQVEGLIDEGEQENRTLKEKLGEAEDFIRDQDEELKRLREKQAQPEGANKEEQNKLKVVQIQHENKIFKEKLAETEARDNSQENRLKAELAQLQQKNKALKEQLGEADSHIADQDQELKRLLGKLAQAEAHIQDEENRLKAKLTLAEQQIDTLQEESTRLKARLASPSPQAQPKLDDAKQQVVNLLEEIRRLNVEKDINQERLQAKQAQIRTLSQALESLSQPVATPLKPQQFQQDANFFRSKLLEAERYIEHLEHINQTNGQVVAQQNEEAKQLAGRTAIFESALQQAEKDRNALAAELANQKDTNNRLKEATGKQVSPGDIVALQNKINDLQGKLNASQGERAKEKKASDQLAQKADKLQQQVSKLEKEKSDADAEGTFFKNKLFQAENYITQLEEASNNNEDLTNKLKEMPALQQQLKELKTALQAQKSETEAKIAKVDALQKKLQEVEEEADFFRKKLLQAETYINHLEQTIPEQQDSDVLKQRLSQAETAAKNWQAKARSAEDKNKELSLMNEELLNHLNDRRPSEEIRRLQDSLVQLRSALDESEATNKTLQSRLVDSPPPASKQPSQEEFFKEKLLQAESYIRELQDQNRKLGDRVQEVAAGPSQEEYEQLGRALEEAQEKNHVLAVQVDRLQQENQQERDQNAQLQQALSDLKGELAKLQNELDQDKEESNPKINELKSLLDNAEKQLNDTRQNLQETAAKKEEAEERAKKFEDLSNNLQESLSILYNIPKHTETSEQPQQQLREAEGKTHQLTADVEQKDNQIAALKEQLSQLQKEKKQAQAQRKQEKNTQEHTQVDKESTIFALEDERNALQDQVNQLQKTNKDLQGEVAALKDQLSFNKQLLYDLQNEKQKQPEEDKQEGGHPHHEQQSKHEQGLSQSIPIDEHGNPVLPKEAKAGQEIKPSASPSRQQQSNAIAVDFLQEKLQQAEELIMQQQNQINKLTDQLVRLQTDSSTLKRQLSTHKREEEDMEEALRAISSSQQDLLQRVEPLENANETLRDQIRQARNTIAELKDKNEAVEKEVWLLKEKNAALEEEKANKPLEDTEKEPFAEETPRALDTLREINKQLEVENKNLAENNQQLSENNHSLQDQNSTLQQANNALCEKCNALQEKNNSVQTKKAQLQGQASALKQANTILGNSNKQLSQKAAQLQQQNNQLQAKNQDLQQKAAELTKENADLLEKNLILEEQLQVNPFEEQHEKFIELQAKVIQLQDADKVLQSALQSAKRDNDLLQQQAAEQSAQSAKQLQDKQGEIQQLQERLNQTETKLDKIASQKDALQKRLEEQLSESGKLTLGRENELAKEVDDLTEKLVNEVMKARELERDLSAKDETNGQLQTALREANESLEEMQLTIENLTRAHDRAVSPLQEQLSAAEEEATKLKTALEEKGQIIQQLAPLTQEKDALEKENNELKQKLSEKEKQNERLLDKERQAEELMGKLSEAQDYIAELQQNKVDAENAIIKVLANAEQIRQQTESLAEKLRTTNAEKEKLLSQIKAMHQQAEMAQSDNERLNSKVSYLNSMLDAKDQQIANLSELSRDRQAEHQALKQGAPQGNTENILPDSYRQDREEDSHTSELNEQVRQLNAELEKKDEENRQLKVERINLQGEVAELQELLKAQEGEEDLKQHLVEADRTNIQLIRQNQQLTEEIEALARDKAYLECEITQLKDKGDAPLSPRQAPLSPRDSDPLEKVQATSTPAPGASPEEISALREQIQQLHAELEQQRARVQEILVHSVENDSLKHIKEDLQQKLHQSQAQRARLLNKLKEAEQALAANTSSPDQEEQLARKDEQLAGKEEELARKQQQLAHAQERIDELQAQSLADRRQQALGQNLKKMLDLSNMQEDIDQELTQQLQNFPYLHEFINSLLYRLRLASALQLQKSLKIKQLTDQLQAAQREAVESRDLRAGNDFLRDQLKRLQEQRRLKEKDEQAKYDEALEELLHYSGLNKDLQAKLAEISELAAEQDKRIKGYEQQLDTSQPSQADNDLSQENYELRRKLQSSEREIQRLRGDSSISSKEVFYMQFLKSCLDKVVDLEREVQQVERTIEQTALEGTQRSQPTPTPEDTLQERLQELEDKLVRNAQNIREHQQRSDGELFDLLRDLAELKELPEASRARIDDYLSQLEAQILREHDQHNAEVSRLRDQVATLQNSQRSNEDSPRGTREELLREITHLNNAIEIYYQESMRRKRNYRRTIEALLADVEKIARLQEEGEGEGVCATTEDMGRRLRTALQNDEQQDAKQMELGDDFIISGNQMQILDNRQKTPLPAIEDREERGTQTDDDPKPFLAFLLSNPDLEKEDLRLLKRKVAELRSREVQESLQALRGQERRLQQVLQLGNRESPQQLDNILLTLANTYSKDEISQIFGSQDNDELLNKLNQALCLEQSFYRGEHSASLLQNILDRKNKYYDSPTKLSEEVYNHLVALLSTKKDEEFYEEIQALFRDLFDTEVGFEQALKKKDELYKIHNERMNQIFNRSSSEGSEEYMNVFEGQHPPEEELEMHSQKKKPRMSQPEHDSGSER